MSKSRRDKTRALHKRGRQRRVARHEARHDERAAAGEWQPRGRMARDNVMVKRGVPPEGVETA